MLLECSDDEKHPSHHHAQKVHRSQIYRLASDGEVPKIFQPHQTLDDDVDDDVR
jgi:hypothetical protein